MIGQIAAVTRRLRVGSGGVMLPNHAPLTVAERFKTLEALFPGRIDLGLGRAPGTDQITSVALRRRQDLGPDDDFLDRFQELTLLETRGYPENHPFNRVHAMPTDAPLPPLWLLGSSDYSAQLAAATGLGFSFAHHFATFDAATAMTRYREMFRPSAARATPYAILAVHAVCAETDEKADELGLSVDLNFLRRSQGEYLPLASPEEVKALDLSAAQRERINRNRERLFVGSPATVRARLMPLVEATKADEVMITSFIFDHEARKRSYALLAQEFGLTSV
jgi:luciferase family oxidoreductase group 1